jgi:hypothetical protein
VALFVQNTYLEAIGGHIGHLYNLGQKAKARSDAAGKKTR